MSKFNKDMSLKDFALAVAKGLAKHNIDVVLTGGAVVSIYSEGKYVSKDADFLTETENKEIESAMLEMGFARKGKDFTHPKTEFSAEFPGRLLVIGDETMNAEGEVEGEGFKLKLLSPTQCVMDRLASYFHWNDRQGLEQAVMVAKQHPVKLEKIKKWAKKEDMLDKFEEFVAELK